MPSNSNFPDTSNLSTFVSLDLHRVILNYRILLFSLAISLSDTVHGFLPLLSISSPLSIPFLSGRMPVVIHLGGGFFIR